MKYSAKGNNYKHGDDVKYIIFNTENPYLQDLHKSMMMMMMMIIIIIIKVMEMTNNNRYNRTRNLCMSHVCRGREIHSGFLVGKPKEKGPLARP